MATGGCTLSASQNTILPIIVLYNTPLAASPSYQSLCASIGNQGAGNQVAVYDNSPVAQVAEAEARRLLAYKHDPDNGGLVAAYNWALEKARSLGTGWLLLLDQDSNLPPSFFESALREATTYGPVGNVVAIVPRVCSGGHVVSPMRVTVWGLSSIRAAASGIQHTPIMAINSGVTIRVSFLDLIGGFNREYWLDFVDHWIFAQIYHRGFCAAVSNMQIAHDLSAQRPYAYSTQRYQSILSSERQFVFSANPSRPLIIYRFQLFFRAIRQLVQYRRPDLSIITLRSMCHWTL